MIFLQIGSNIGDRYSNLMTCIKNIELFTGKIINKSKIYVSECWGVQNQRDYFNMVVAVKSIYNPFKVLKIISKIENDMGRIRKKKWDSRIIDIDILFFGKQIIKSKELIIPHEHLYKRMFVLRPLADIAPFFIHPVLKKNIKQLIKECKDDNTVFEYEL
tara:strand:+ start:2357 stop:2836 length:480 start_codon:yes stop_codon:yes gene_type:complete